MRLILQQWSAYQVQHSNTKDLPIFATNKPGPPNMGKYSRLTIKRQVGPCSRCTFSLKGRCVHAICIHSSNQFLFRIKALRRHHGQHEAATPAISHQNTALLCYLTCILFHYASSSKYLSNDNPIAPPFRKNSFQPCCRFLLVYDKYP